MRRLAAILALAAMMTLGAAPARASEVRLQPGDVIRVTVTGMPELSGAAPIDNDGMVRLPQFDPIRVAGSTLAAVQSELRQGTAGRLVRRFDAMTGAPIMLSVAADDVYLTVEAYRPVHVMGAVATPGAKPFRPGMTVRALLAEAGGIRTTPAQGQDAISRAPRLVGDIRALTIERARLRAEIWRLEVELGRREAEPPPDAAQLGVGEGAAGALVAAQRRLMELGAMQVQSQRNFLDAAIAQTEKRADILREQENQQRDAVDADEEELARTRRLLERGVVPNDRLLDIRRAQVLSATRLLSTQSELSRTELEKIRLAEQKSVADPLRDAESINRLLVATGRLDEVEARIGALREEMELAGLSALAFAETPALETVVTVYRRSEGTAGRVDVGLDDFLEPGDVVEVALAPLLQ